MRLFCTHDPHNPDHIVCQASWSFHDLILVAVGLVFVVVTILVVVIRIRIAHKQTPNILVNNEESQQYSGQSDLSRAESRDQYLEPQLDSQALYFSKEGEQVGRGPWPLKAGETTQLKIFWRFILSDLEQQDIVVKAKLAPGVMWTGFVPIGSGITYIPEERAIRWRPGDQTALVFEVSVTPTPETISDDSLLILDKLSIHLTWRDNNSSSSREFIMPNTVMSPLTK